MKIVYIAHTIGGDQEGNMKRVVEIVRYINLTTKNVFPFAPYLADLMAMDDRVPEERERGFRNNEQLFRRKAFDELWVCGKISRGVATEIEWANEMKIPVRMRTDIWETIVEAGREWPGEEKMFP